MKTITRYFGAVIGMSFAIWMITLGGYHLYKNHQAKSGLMQLPASAQSYDVVDQPKAADSIYQKATDIVILNAN